MTRVNEGSHSFTCQSPHLYPRMEWAILPLLSSCTALSYFGRYRSPVQQRVGSWVGLRGWLHTKVVCQPEDDHLSQY